MKVLKFSVHIILVLIIVFSFAGCDDSSTENDITTTESLTSSETTTEEEETETTEETVQETTESISTALVEENGEEFKTEYYTLTFPLSIKDLYVAYIIKTSYAYDVCVYDTASVDAGADGFVFSVCLYENMNEYEGVPDYDFMGILTIDGSNMYYVVMEYATDVQYVSSTQESWQNISNCSEEIKASLKADSSAGAEYTIVDESYDDYSEEESNTYTTSSSVQTCYYCGGKGVCQYCVAGSCSDCNGLGGEYCTACATTGFCPKCGRSGYYYEGAGISFRKVICKKCNGQGICPECSGKGFLTCSSCNGSGNCKYCGGDFVCHYCGGSGTLEN